MNGFAPKVRYPLVFFEGTADASEFDFPAQIRQQPNTEGTA